MNRIVAIILTIVLSVASATASIRHYCDYLGSTRAVVDTSGVLLQTMNYYPSGVPFSRMEQEPVTDRLHTGKPFLDMNGLGYYDNNARFLDILTGGFISRDALAGSYPHLSPYANCANNPLIYIDLDGNEWYTIDEVKHNHKTGKSYTEAIYLYTPLKSQEEMDAAGVKGRFLGETVVTFNGSMNEKLGEGQSLYGKGAVLADVTVYGPNGANDIKQYKGYTMSSDFEKFGAIADGEYNVNYVVPGKGGSLSSNYAINNGNAVDCINGVNPSPKEYNPYSPTQKNGIYIHRSNNNGWAGDNPSKKSAVSTGCLLILPKQWDQFCNQIGKNNFKLILNRTK